MKEVEAIVDKFEKEYPAAFYLKAANGMLYHSKKLIKKAIVKTKKYSFISLAATGAIYSCHPTIMAVALGVQIGHAFVRYYRGEITWTDFK